VNIQYYNALLRLPVHNDREAEELYLIFFLLKIGIKK